MEVKRQISSSDIAFMLNHSSGGSLSAGQGKFIALINDKAVVSKLVSQALTRINDKTASALSAFLCGFLARVLQGKVVDSNLPELLSVLIRSTGSFKQVLAERRDPDDKLLPFSPRQLVTLRLVRIMAESRSCKVLQRLSDKKLLHACWDAFFRHPLCSCLHSEILRISEQLFCTPSCRPAAVSFIESYGLLTKLLDLLSSNKRKGARGVAHVSLSSVAQAVFVCRWISQMDSPELQEKLKENERWQRYAKSMAFDDLPDLLPAAADGTAKTLGLDDGTSNPHPEDFNFLLSLF